MKGEGVKSVVSLEEGTSQQRSSAWEDEENGQVVSLEEGTSQQRSSAWEDEEKVQDMSLEEGSPQQRISAWEDEEKVQDLSLEEGAPQQRNPAWEDEEKAEEPPDDEADHVVTWKEFTENTTFHGVKYVFENGACLRRLFWLLIIMGCMMFFVVQVGMRIRDYYDFDTVTSVTQQAATTIEFPAVTLCNLNRFRISKAKEGGLYEYLNEHFSSAGKTDKNATHVTDTEHVMTELGHELEQLIDVCYWRGEKCNLSKDFKRRQLDIGLCYTFNHDVDDGKMVDQAGMEGGLQLLLNIETFEHMRGSNLDAGVKFLLHNPEDEPALRHLGFVATPGQHTLVAIKLAKTVTLPEPWGECIEDGQRVTVCQLECISQDFQKHCNCSDIHMMPSEKYPVCDLNTKFTCGCSSSDTDITKCGTSCTCPSPCEENRYKPALSSSMLSKINLDSFALTAPGKIESTNASFQAAAEIQLKVSPNFQKSYLHRAEAIVKSYRSISEVDSRYNPSVPGSVLSHITGLVDSIYRSEGDLEPGQLLAAKKTLLDVCPIRITSDILEAGLKLIEVVRHMKTFVWHGDPDTCDSWNDTLGYSYTSLFYQYLCYGFRFTGNNDVPNINWNVCEVPSGGGYPDYCDKYFMECICYLNGYLDGMKLELGSLFDNSMDRYGTALYDYTGVYNFTDSRLAGNTEHEACVNMSAGLPLPSLFIRQILEGIQIDFMEGGYYYQFKDFAMLPIWDDMVVPGSPSATSLFQRQKSYGEACCWPEEFLYFFENGVTSEKENFENIVYQYRLLNIDFLLADSDAMFELARKSDTRVMDDVVREIERYTNGELKTRELAVIMAGPSIARQTYSLVSGTETKLRLMISLQTGLEKIEDALPPFIFDLINKMTASLTDPLQVKASAMMEFLGRNDTKRLGVFTDACKDKSFPEFGVDEIDTLIQLTCSLAEILAKDIETLSADIKEFELNANALLEILNEFYQDTEMNDNFYMSNFLQVDLYYEELVYEDVEQQKAFILVSLFSEIGGFLGLLLGASVLTMCELIDFLFVNMVIKNNTNHQKT